MSQPFDENAAAEALFEAVQADRAESRDTPSIKAAEAAAPENKQEVPAHEEPTENNQEAVEALESLPFEQINPNELPPELLPAYKNMQAKFTQTQQSLAEERKQYEVFEDFGGVDAAREAVEFVSALASDPTYALQVHEQLTQALTDAGLTPSQASAEAARQIDDATAQAPVEDEDEFGFGTDPRIQQELNTTKSELAEIKAWRDRIEEETLQRNMLAEVERMHAQVVSKHPEWDDPDLENVYRLSYSTGGDLIQAAEIYNGFRDTVISSYLESKAQVPTGVTPMPNSGSAVQPEKFTDLNDPNLQRLAHERLEQMMAHAQGNT